jgi:hypothetical protein
MRAALLLVLGLLSAGCLPHGKGAADASGQQAEPTDQELAASYGEQVATQVADIRAKRRAALASPTSLPSASAYADALIAGLQGNLAQINGIDWRAYVKDGAETLGSATQNAQGAEAADALAKRASFQASLGDEASALVSLRSAFDRGHTYLSGLGMLSVYAHENKPAEANALCEKTRQLATNEGQVYDLLRECLKVVEEKETAQAALPWVNAADWAMFESRQREEQERRLAQRQAEEERDRQWREQQAQSPTQATQAGASNQPSSSGPERVSFTLRSSCSKTVSVFFGQTPKYGSGRTTPIGGNSVQNESLNAGDMLWLVDGSGNGLSSVSVSTGTREVEIGSSCTSLSSR